MLTCHLSVIKKRKEEVGIVGLFPEEMVALITTSKLEMEVALLLYCGKGEVQKNRAWYLNCNQGWKNGDCGNWHASHRKGLQRLRGNGLNTAYSLEAGWLAGWMGRSEKRVDASRQSPVLFQFLIPFTRSLIVALLHALVYNLQYLSLSFSSPGTSRRNIYELR